MVYPYDQGPRGGGAVASSATKRLDALDGRGIQKETTEFPAEDVHYD